MSDDVTLTSHTHTHTHSQGQLYQETHNTQVTRRIKTLKSFTLEMIWDQQLNSRTA